MFDDILGPRKKELKPYLGEKKAASTSVGGVNSSDRRDSNKKPQGVTGLKGRPIPAPAPVNSNKVFDFDPDDDLWNDEDGCCEEDCDCDCGDSCGCLKDEWSTIE